MDREILPMRGALANGVEIQAARLNRGLTQDQLAELAGVDTKTIRNAEQGRRIDASTVKQIADALGQPLSAIIVAEDDSTGAIQQNIELYWAWQKASNDRSIEGMLLCYHPEGSVFIAGADGLPGGGEFCGLDAIRQQWSEALEAFETEVLTADRVQVDAVGDYVFARATATGMVRATGVTFTSLGVHEFLMKDGKIFRHRIIVDTAAIRRGLEANG